MQRSIGRIVVKGGPYRGFSLKGEGSRRTAKLHLIERAVNTFYKKDPWGIRK
jgi:hypothetical protein